MTIRNPWIDPRVTQVHTADVRAYLLRRNWKPLPPEHPNFLPFESSSGEWVLQLPLLEQARDFPQRLIELLTDLSRAENRQAADVLTDLLQEKTNGQPQEIVARAKLGPDEDE